MKKAAVAKKVSAASWGRPGRRDSVGATSVVYRVSEAPCAPLFPQSRTEAKAKRSEIFKRAEKYVSEYLSAVSRLARVVGLGVVCRCPL